MLGVCVWSFVAAITAACGLAPASASSGKVPSAPVVADTGSGGFAVAVPALAGPPAFAGEAIAFVIEDTSRSRMFSVRLAGPGGVSRQLFTAPRRRAGSASSLGASSSHVVALRTRTGRSPTCAVGGECTPEAGALLAGPVTGPLAPSFRTTERLAPAGSCRRRIAELHDDVSLSGERVAYVQRVRCMEPRRRARSQVVVRDLRTDRIRVVHRGRASRVQLAGRYLAFRRGSRPGGRVVVRDLRTRRVAYRAEVGWEDYFSLGADGTLVHTNFPEGCCTLTGRIGWYSISSPRAHVLRSVPPCSPARR